MTLQHQEAETTTLIVNGAEVSVRSDHPHLLSALRDELGLTSVKDGCSPSGQCGCCTVLVDGKAMVSCVTTVEKAAGRTVTTLEGFDDTERDRLARAFATTGALQCGFCTPGIVVRAKALVDQKGSALDRSTIEGRLGAHLCRCTGYVKIVDAIELLASGEPIPDPVLSKGNRQGRLEVRGSSNSRSETETMSATSSCPECSMGHSDSPTTPAPT